MYKKGLQGILAICGWAWYSKKFLINILAVVALSFWHVLFCIQSVASESSISQFGFS